MAFAAEPFVNRIRKNHAHLVKWAVRNDIEAWRLYDRDMPEYPFSVDKYAGALVMHYFDRKPNPLFSPETDEIRAQEEISGARAALAQWASIPLEKVFVKRRRARLGGDQYEKVGEQGVTAFVREQGLKFLVNLSDYLDTGLFLDHRRTRAMVQTMVKGQRVLNLFAYTGAISVYACAGEASEVVTVDMSNTYLEWAGENLKLNGFDVAQHPLVRADVLRFLKDQCTAGERYDFIVCDPPSFSNSKKMLGYFDVQEHHAALLKECAALLNPGGSILFSNNLRSFKMDGAALAELEIEDVTKRTLPEDFRNERIHRAFLLRKA